ncbi:TonB-dependent receptor [Sphingomonas sp. PP-F2F-A104-K0414]|uniref:TonB-dependent receptor n=1 Tax=Sphingomonas sp. PP-F2F-A104-K0414 TaxID=2135661 RepID=UPI00105164DC|nr:TonB-dependent receptor [Sphingomonas sp. PP-F2F-A104-K0414]TCP96671.1 TonB-dependent receptor [Sphingomonas sp. PP-F2F-A104-K0414]
MKRSKISVGSIKGLSTTVSLLALVIVGSVAQAQVAAPQDGAPASVADAQQTSGTAAPSADQGQAVDTAPVAAEAGDDIVVTGVRASLQSAQNIKRNSAQIVDSIVAEDIGKLPDRNIAEALQRISGIQIQRNFGEGSSVAIRGLTQVRTELNGRDIFTASGSSNALSLEDVPSELLAGIDVYKNPSADLIEDHLSGTINFRTRKPFDFDAFKISGSATNTYYDLIKKSQPAASLLVSDRWNTGIGEIGMLASASYQKTNFRQDTISTEPFYTLDESNPGDAATAALLGRTGQTTTLPHGTGIGEVFGDRRRLGIDVSLQWRPTDTLEFTGEVFRNDYKLRSYGYSYFAYTSGASITPLAGAPFTYAPNGDFQSGTFTNVPIGNNTSLGSRHSVTTDYSLNGKWKPTANLTITGDLQYVDSKTDNLNSIVGLSGVATTLTQDISGEIPSFQIASADGLANPATYSNGFYLDNLNNSKGTDKVGRLDGEYRFDGGILSSIKAGFRFADRRNRTSDTGYRYTGLTGAATNLRYVDLSGFFRGQADLFGDIQAFSLPTVLDYDATRASLGIATTPSYVPSGTNTQAQKTYTGYAAAFFKADDLPVPIDGNIGVRVVQSKVAVSGFYQQVDLITAPDGTQSTAAPTFTEVNEATKYTSVLPSLNVRGRLTDWLQLRFAASKNISRPNFNQLNPSLTITEPGTAQIDQQHVTSTGNPYLKPMKSTNFDASLEWYFAKSGSLTVAGFYKDISNYIQTVITPRDVTFTDGVTATYDVTTYSNAAKAKVKGAEVAYQQFFDFLPGPLAGLGVQANFTYVDSEAPSPASDGPVTQLSLEGLSKYNYNLIGIYERGIVSARVAYNWRSEFLVTTSANGTGNLPQFQKASGQLDASITANVTPHLSLTLNGTNLTNTVRSTYYGITTRPRDSIMSDRQISGVARITF